MRHTPCQPEHLRQIAAQPSQVRAIATFAAVLERQRAELEKTAWTLWSGSHPVGAMGLVCVFPGLYEAWAYLSSQAILQPVALARTARSGLAEASRTLAWRRMQAFCLAEDTGGYAWLGFLGFRFEGVLRRYGPGAEDMAIFGRVR